jgi:plasmid stability protein
MASVTIKDIPVEILERLRQRAAADHRSLNKEVIHLLGAALSHTFTPDNAAYKKEVADRQAEAWDRLAGRWDSDQRVEDEIADIFSARSEGRDIAL